MCADEVGPFVRLQEFKCDQRGRDALITEGHSRSSYDAPIGHNVLIMSVVGKGDARKWRAMLKTIAEPLDTPNSKIRFKLLDFVAFPFGEPAAFPGGVLESGEDAFRRLRITALDDECVVDNG